MEKKDFVETQINAEDYIDPKGNASKKKSKKLWISLVAAVAALTVAVSAISISFAAPETVPAALTLSSEEESSGIILTDVSDVVDEVLPSVVSITSRSLVNYYGDNFGNFYDDRGFGGIWDYFFGDSFGRRSGDYYYYEYPEAAEPEEGTEEIPDEIDTGMGSGTIIAETDEELLILTSYHVVEGCSSLYVTFINDASVDGYIKSADSGKDIAIVAVPLADIEQDTLNAIKIATISTQTPDVGDGCIVIGNALGYGISVTTGIVSALDRDIYVEGKTLTVLQTDAAINNGNSGGCMLNTNGEIIGINEAKVRSSMVEGMCYAIPVASNLDLIDELINSEGITSSQDVIEGEGAFLGIRGRDVTTEISNDYGFPLGVYVSETVQGSGAKEAGVLGGDIIVGIDGVEVTTMTQLQYELSSHKAGDEVVLEVMRNTEGEYVSLEIPVTLTDRIS